MSKPEATAFLDTFNTLRRALSAVAIRAYGTLDLGQTQVRIVKHLGEQRHVSQAALARAIDTDPALTGRVLLSLIERGLVCRERSEEDKREFLLSLTAEGQKLHRRVLRIREQLAERLLEPLDARDRADFARIAQKLTRAFSDNPPKVE